MKAHTSTRRIRRIEHRDIKYIAKSAAHYDWLHRLYKDINRTKPEKMESWSLLLADVQSTLSGWGVTLPDMEGNVKSKWIHGSHVIRPHIAHVYRVPEELGTSRSDPATTPARTLCCCPRYAHGERGI